MNTPIIQLLFPTPILINCMDRNFTQAELDFVDKHSKIEMIHENYGNSTSNNTYVLNEPELKDLHDFCLSQVKLYLTEIYKPNTKIEPYITQSWLNYTNKNEFHHKHNHPNSFISGVLYINADETKDKIKFYSPIYRQLMIHPHTYDQANSDSWWVSTSSGSIVLFPSHLDHQVDKVITDKTRISLAFNAFVKGHFGNKETLTELFYG